MSGKEELARELLAIGHASGFNQVQYTYYGDLDQLFDSGMEGIIAGGISESEDQCAFSAGSQDGALKSRCFQRYR